MPTRLRKILAAAALLVFIPFYALLAMQVAAVHLPGTTVLVQTIYFAIAGLLWIFPARLIIAWMQRP
jgi:hypothetical protein